MTKQNVDALRQLIAAEITANPFEHEGFQWCALPQPVIVAKLGIPARTLRRMIGKPPLGNPPFVPAWTHRDGKPVTLLRVGEPGPNSKKQVQTHLSNIWRKETGRPFPKPLFGLLGGMVDAWGMDKAPDIFRLTLKRWPEFMAGAHIEIVKIGGTKRYYKHPSPGFILRFNSVAMELYQMEQQQKAGKASPDIGNPKTLKLKPGPNKALDALKAGKSAGKS